MIGVLGLRCPGTISAQAEAQVRTAAFLAAASFRLLLSLDTETRRNRQLLLVSDLGRKVNSILDDELLLKQAAGDIHRTFGFHNVMIFMRDGEVGNRLILKAQASAYAVPSKLHAGVSTEEGVVGRVFRRGTA